MKHWKAKNVLKLSALLCSILVLAGCWSRLEPKNMAVINSTLYDLGKYGNYKIVVELLNPSASGTGKQPGSISGQSSDVTATGEGDSYPEAIRAVSTSLEKFLYGGHNKVRFISERLAKAGIQPLIEYLLRDFLTDERPTMVVIAGDTPELIYSSKIGLSNLVGDYIQDMSRSQPQEVARAVFPDTLGFVKDSLHKGKQPVAGLIRIEECKDKASLNSTIASGGKDDQGLPLNEYKIVYEGLAAFKNYKLAGYMNGTEARAYNIITNNLQLAIISIPDELGESGIRVLNSSAKIKTKYENGQAVFDVNVKMNIKILQPSGPEDADEPGPQKVLEDKVNYFFEAQLLAAVKKAQQEFKSDIFGFGVQFHIDCPEVWQQIQDQWDDYFSRAKINVTVKSTMISTGEIKDPITVEEVS